MMNKVHKICTLTYCWEKVTECNRLLFSNQGQWDQPINSYGTDSGAWYLLASKNWDDVTCKSCLKHKK